MPDNEITDEQITALIENIAEDVNESIRQQLEDDELAAISEIISYPVSTGGKRLRPTLAILISQCLGGDYQQTIDMATTCELIHSASTIYDDILDGDIVRRGKPAAHTLYNAGTAMMGGNVLVLMAVKLGVARGLPITAMLINSASSLTVGSTEEQLFHDYNEERYYRIIGLKTATLFKGACELGAIMAGAQRPEFMIASKYGWNIGMLYQLTDDLTDILLTHKTGEMKGHMKNGTPTLAFIHAHQATTDPIIEAVMDKFLTDSPLSVPEFNVIYEHLIETGALRYTLDKIEEYNKACHKACLQLPASRSRDYLAAMPRFLYRVLMSEVEGFVGLEGVKDEAEPPTEE
jgi:octaprenyl-diphosphate synthase